MDGDKPESSSSSDGSSSSSSTEESGSSDSEEANGKKPCSAPVQGDEAASDPPSSSDEGAQPSGAPPRPSAREKPPGPLERQAPPAKPERPTKKLKRHREALPEFELTVDTLQGRWRHSVSSLGMLTVRGSTVQFDVGNVYELEEIVPGPPVGKARKDGSMLLEVDEWIRELFDATPPRAGTTCPEGFDASAAADALSEHRPWLWQGFATEKEVQDAAAEMDVLRERGVLKAANADTTGAQKARSDRIAFLELDNEKPASCLRLFRRMEAAVAALRWSEGGQLLRPKFGMAAVYDKGGSYAPHRDNERTGQRLRQWVNFRALTAVIYVNPSGFTSPEDGGQLRCHLGAKIDDLSGATALEVQDVAPRGGLAVLFPARRVLHEVLPSFRQRYALTLWFVAPAAGLD